MNGADLKKKLTKSIIHQKLFSKTKAKNGFSIIELLIVGIITAVLAVATTNLFISSMQSGGKSSLLNKIRANGDYAVSQMERVIRSAKQINSTCNDTNQVPLQLENYDGTTNSFSLAGNRLEANPNDFLTSDAFVVSGVSFVCTPGTGIDPSKVKIKFTLTAGDPTKPSEYVQESFQTTVLLRNY